LKGISAFFWWFKRILTGFNGGFDVFLGFSWVFDAFNGGFNGRLMDSYPLVDGLLGQTMGLT